MGGVVGKQQIRNAAVTVDMGVVVCHWGIMEKQKGQLSLGVYFPLPFALINECSQLTLMLLSQIQRRA